MASPDRPPIGLPPQDVGFTRPRRSSDRPTDVFDTTTGHMISGEPQPAPIQPQTEWKASRRDLFKLGGAIAGTAVIVEGANLIGPNIAALARNANTANLPVAEGTVVVNPNILTDASLKADLENDEDDPFRPDIEYQSIIITERTIDKLQSQANNGASFTLTIDNPGVVFLNPEDITQQGIIGKKISLTVDESGVTPSDASLITSAQDSSEREYFVLPAIDTRDLTNRQPNKPTKEEVQLIWSEKASDGTQSGKTEEVPFPDTFAIPDPEQRSPIEDNYANVVIKSDGIKTNSEIALMQSLVPDVQTANLYGGEFHMVTLSEIPFDLLVQDETTQDVVGVILPREEFGKQTDQQPNTLPGRAALTTRLYRTLTYGILNEPKSEDDPANDYLKAIEANYDIVKYAFLEKRQAPHTRGSDNGPVDPKFLAILAQDHYGDKPFNALVPDYAKHFIRGADIPGELVPVLKHHFAEFFSERSGQTFGQDQQQITDIFVGLTLNMLNARHGREDEMKSLFPDMDEEYKTHVMEITADIATTTEQMNDLVKRIQP